MDIQNSDFSFSVTLKITEMPLCKAHKTFPEVSDLAVNSRTFESYVECVTSARAFMEDVVKDANSQNTIQLSVSAEVNPEHSGLETRSRDWAAGELARFWIFDKTQEGARNINAVGQARIFALDRADAPLPN